MKKLFLSILILCGIYVHRNVLMAYINKSTMPKAPYWHCWVKEQNRKKKPKN